TEHLDVGVFLSARVDLAAGLLDLAVEGVDEGQQAVEPTPRPLAQLELGEEAATAGPEQVAVAGLHPGLGQDWGAAVLERGAHAGERDPVAEQVAQVAQVAWRDVRLRQQIRTQEVRERPRVDRVRLHPGSSDRLRPQRMREMQLEARLLEQISQPLPTVSRLERNLGVIAQSLQ